MSKTPSLAPAFIALSVFAVAIWAAKPYAVGVFHDDGVYVILAKALATGHGYHYLHLPGMPAATHYPIGYPFFLSILWRIAPSFPGNIGVFLVANAVLLALTAVAVERFARTVLDWSPAASFAAALVATLSYPLILLSSLVLSEALFAALLFGSLVLAERAIRNEDEGRTPLTFIALGVAAGVIVLVRTHGAALLLATLIVLAYRRRWRAMALVALPAIAIIAPWQIWTMMQPALDDQLRGSYGSYLDWFAQGIRSNGVSLFARTIALNTTRVGGLLADRFALIDAPVNRGVTALVCAAAIMLGAWRSSRRAPITIVFAITYVAVLLVWPYTPWRFVYAIWPLVILAIGESIRPAFQIQNNASLRKWTAVGCAALFGVGALRQEIRAYALRTWRLPGNVATAQVLPTIRWASRETAPSDLLAVEGEQLVYLFANRTAVPITPFTAEQYVRTPAINETEATLATLLMRFPIAYVATISAPVTAAADSLAAHGDSSTVRLTRVGPLDRRGAGVVYRVNR